MLEQRGEGNSAVRIKVDALQLSSGRGAYCHLEEKCLFDARLSKLLLASLKRFSKGKQRAPKKGSAAGKGIALSEKFLTDALAEVESNGRKNELYNVLRNLCQKQAKPAKKPLVRRVRL